MRIPRPLSRRPIPETARRVFKGKIFDVYQWDQSLYDGSVETFEKIKRADTVNVIPVTTDHKLVLSEQEQPGREPFVGALGGRIDDGETPEEAARRELLEEAGMRSDELVLWDAQQVLEKVDWAIYTFIAKDCQVVQEQSLDAGEKIKLIHVSFEEFLDLTSKDNYRDVEISLSVFRTSRDARRLEEMRTLFLGL